MQAQLAQAQNEINDMTFEASAGGGMVSAVANGDMSIKSVSVNPAALELGDAEMLEDMICAAVNEALRGVSELSQARLNSVTGGMNIPGLM